jgi:NAD(P)-dependent dehydrogenase (short-subunit alcohol dehydrogenase family)
MNGQKKTAIVTGASQGIGAGVAKAFLERGGSTRRQRTGKVS